MKGIVTALLALANVVVLVLLAAILNTGHADHLTISDLRYGSVDLDGDGRYTVGDDLVLQWFLEHNAVHIERALKEARVNEDGGIDLSPYLLSVGMEGSAVREK